MLWEESFYFTSVKYFKKYEEVVKRCYVLGFKKGLGICR
ncbi:TPA: hypothetical protein O2Z46_001687 [Staphylococcus aureus]|nr:hypothetical protein [Staphylococcus aureus]HDJ6917791.1 hypothetical protein [Staphylococcus aureus Sa_TPS3169]HDJ6920615.1 hypothetical protein [Staphylococcus aureus Sa_TPS3162]HDJ6929018.1 hypothetical protein [Staphylococcus aureus Sa_TPS3157]HDJ6931280.1 hypothetical protein [Staphylococcus aureus Sa_TPS3148]HDJ6936875.1 hypothetical protein [Staphylococcus aureus Sa_TPS3161]HDJ6942476.1 hypothetical protein [Staphylococcus aureus Sa_TPS3174]HDJ6948057.1 hypothetical protein [Staphy